MARNEEKAQAMLNRWYKMKRDLRNAEMGKYKETPEIGKCISIQDCEFERLELLKVVSKKVSDIQNAGLGEHRIRELNDEINKVIREKQVWEQRIKELGGPDYRRISAKMLDSTAVELPGAGGYKYFGTAKDLPGVRELFQKPTPYEPKKSRAELYKQVTYDYYGFSAHKNGQLVEEEKRLENLAKEEEIKRFVRDNTQIVELMFEGQDPTLLELQQFLNQEMKLREDEDRTLRAQNELDLMQVLEEEVLERKKQSLIEEYIMADDRTHDFSKFQDQKDIEIEEMAKQMIKMNTQL